MKHLSISIVLAASLMSLSACSEDPSTGQKLVKSIDKLVAKWKSQANGKKLKYTWGGYVDTFGNLAGDKKGLACNSFAAPVLAELLLAGDFRVLKGDGTRGGKDYRWAHQWFGGDTADYFGLQEEIAGLSLTDFIGRAKKGTLPTGTFYFDLRNAKAKNRAYYIGKGKDRRLPKKGEIGNSHTGFILIEKGAAPQSVSMHHFSEIGKGLFRGKFISDFLEKSLYGRTKDLRDSSSVSLWKIAPTPNKKVNTAGSDLNLRESASSASNVVVKMPKGHVVQVLEKGKEWCKCRYMSSGHAYVGYAAAKYLK